MPERSVQAIGGLTTTWGEVELEDAGTLCGLKQENAAGALVAAYTPDEARIVAAGLVRLAAAVEAKRAGGGRA